MKKIMISQPMNGLDDDLILKKRYTITKELQNKGYKVIDSYIDDYPSDEEVNKVIHIPVNYLAKSIDVLSRVDTIFLCKGWENARGCKIEHQIAKEYGIEILYEEEQEDNLAADNNDIIENDINTLFIGFKQKNCEVMEKINGAVHSYTVSLDAMIKKNTNKLEEDLIKLLKK